MSRIQRSTIEAIRSQVNIVDVVSAYSQMKRIGSQYRGLSPFNEEKTPSFYVHPEKNVFKCYSSGHAGDLFRFIELKENLPFHEAVIFLAQRFGIPVEYEEGSSQDNSLSIKKELYAIHELATQFFHHCFLAQNEDAHKIQNYWVNNRSFPLSLAKELLIGLSPKAGNPLLQELQRHSFSEEALRNCGLFYTKESIKDIQHMRPRFRGRLMIPIRDIQGRIIAFTARISPLTPKDDPTYDAKYINSPETPLFTKSHVVFGLEHARQHVKDESSTPFVLVEGQLDTLRCWHVGIHTAVAPQGTSVTPQQLSLLRRYHRQIDVLMDGDAAGIRAALRLLPMGIEAGLEMSFLCLPESEDPDSLLLKGGKTAWEALLKNKKDAIGFAIESLVPEGRLASPHSKEAALRELFSIYQKADSLPLAESALKRAGQLLGISEYTIDHELPKLKIRTSSPQNHSIRDEKLTSYADILLIAASTDPALANALANTIQAEWIDSSLLSGLLLNRLLAAIREGLWRDKHCTDELLENDDERNHFYSLLAREDLHLDQLPKAAEEALRGLFERHFQTMKESTTRLLANTDPNDHDQLRTLQNKRIQIRRILEQPPSLTLS